MTIKKRLHNLFQDHHIPFFLNSPSQTIGITDIIDKYTGVERPAPKGPVPAYFRDALPAGHVPSPPSKHQHLVKTVGTGGGQHLPRIVDAVAIWGKDIGDIDVRPLQVDEETAAIGAAGNMDVGNFHGQVPVR